MGNAERANFCSHCGSPLDRDANYCQQCGTRCRPTAPADETRDDASENRDDDLLAFRRRVQDRLADGWEVEHDEGDSVVLIDRGFGSLAGHVVLFLFTGGIGNLILAWYRYSHTADRIVLRADGNDYRPDANDSETGDIEDLFDPELDGSSLGAYIVGAVLLLFGAAFIVALEPLAFILGLLSLLGAAWAFPETRHRLKNRHPVTTFGHTRSTEETTVSDPETPCVVCASPVESGVERSYREEYVAAGVPLFTTESGENRYCRSCATGDVSDVGVTPMAAANRDGSEKQALETEDR